MSTGRVKRVKNHWNAERLVDRKILQRGQSSLRSRKVHQEKKTDKVNGLQSVTRTIKDN